MLASLQIRNFAIIDQAEVELQPGMTVLTGETGAGKSILVDAMGLIRGDRGDRSVVRAGGGSTVVEALFELAADHPVRAWCEHAGVVPNSLGRARNI